MATTIYTIQTPGPDEANQIRLALHNSDMLGSIAHTEWVGADDKIFAHVKPNHQENFVAMFHSVKNVTVPEATITAIAHPR